MKPYTEVIDGVEVVGVAFAPKEPRFYEFVNPDEHDSFHKLECPRSGKTVVHDNQIEREMSKIMGGFTYVTIPVELWQEFRDVYVTAEEHDFDKWKSMWDEIMDKDPRL